MGYVIEPELWKKIIKSLPYREGKISGIVKLAAFAASGSATKEKQERAAQGHPDQVSLSSAVRWRVDIRWSISYKN